MMLFIKKSLNNNQGSVGILALLAMMFFGIIGGAYMTLSASGMKTSTNVRDNMAAQYLAEAGAQWAVAKITAEPTYGTTRTTYSSSVKNPGTITAGIYEVTVEPNATDPGQCSIRSTGKVNQSTSTVVITLKLGGIFRHALYSNGNIAIDSGKVKGDTGSNGKITISGHQPDTIEGSAECASFDELTGTDSHQTVKGEVKPATGERLDIGKLMDNKPFFTRSGTDLRTITPDAQNLYTLNNGSYYYDGNYSLYDHGYNLPVGKAATIYVNGNFEIGQNIIADDLTIYVNGNLTFTNAKSIIQNPNNYKIKIYATGNVEWNSNVTTGKGLIVTNGNIKLTGGASAPQTIFIAGGSIEVNQNSTVGALYANNEVFLRQGAIVDYGKVKDFAQELNSPPTVSSWSNR